MARWRAAWIAGAVLGAGAVGWLALRSLFFLPPPVLEVEPACQGSPPAITRGEPLRVLVWNAQYAAGRHDFFYDGGQVVSVPVEEVRATLERIAAVVDEADPDLVLWQELDRDSRRTGRVDQVAALAGRWPCHASTPYHRARFVPHPIHEPLGRVDMHLATASRYWMSSATRHALPLLEESAVRRLFNLRRAVLEARLPLEGGGELLVMNTHLSAFSRGDGTLGRQVAHLEARVAAAEAAGTPWLLAGDLNALPPGDDPARLGDDAALYAERVTPIDALLRRHSVVPVEAYQRDPERWRTYVPYGAAGPDRTLDYALAGGGLEVRSAEVLRGHEDLSDHLPLLLEVVVE